MIKVDLLDFLMNGAHHISVLNCSSAFEYVEDLFEKILTAKYCDAEIDLGIMYFRPVSNSNYILIDGKRRLLALSLLLKVISDKHSELVEVSEISNQINLKCLKFSTGVKLQLFGLEKTVYEKIINNEPLSYTDKQTSVYSALEILRDNINSLEFDTEQLYEMLSRLKMSVIYVDSIKERDVFYSINKDLRPLNQMMLIKSYLAELSQGNLVDKLYSLFGYKEAIFVSFFQSFLSPKFNRIITDCNSIYDYFVKYIETVKKYQNFEDISKSITKTAKLYKKMYNAEFSDSEIRNMFIKIVTNDGKDTFAYLLELCEDYSNGYLAKSTFLEICNIINTYVLERKNKASINEHCNFTQVVKELNKVIYEEQNTQTQE